MTSQMVITAVRPSASDEEVAAITIALTEMWPQRQTRRLSRPDVGWRFGRRYSRSSLRDTSVRFPR